MAITNTSIGWTNIDTSNALPGYKRAVVWFSTGEVASIASLNAAYSISWDGTPVETSWSELSYRDWRGTLRTMAPHPDGSIRAAVAEFSATLDAGAASPTEHTVVATVVARSNTPPTASHQTTAIGQLELSVTYHDDEESATYGPTDMMDMARQGSNSATMYEDDIGLRKLIFAEGYMGRGRHHQPTRTLGHNNFGGASNPPVEVDGLLHVTMDWQFPSGATWGVVTVEFANDQLCPYPCEPPDDGAAYAAHPTRASLRTNHTGNRPTQLTAPAEVLESPRVRHLQNLQVRIQRTGGGTCHVYPMYIDDEETGAGPWGTVADAGSGWWDIPITGLGIFKGWGMRFAVSFNSAAEAEQIARTFESCIGLIKYATSWDANDQPSGSWVDIRRTMDAFPYTDDAVDMAGWEVPIKRDIPEATVTAWYAGCATDYSNFLGTTNANPWDLLGGTIDPAQGGPHRQILWMQEADTYLAASSHRLYIAGAQALREYSVRGPVIWQMDTLSGDMLTFNGSGRGSHYIFASGGYINRFSGHSCGLLQYYSSGGGSPPRIWYDGDEFSETNPDSNHGAGTQTTWINWDYQHWGTRVLYFYALFTADPWSMRRLHQLAYHCMFMFHQRGDPTVSYSPMGIQGRGELRPMRSIIHGFVASNDHTPTENMMQRVRNWTNPNCPSRWGDILFNYNSSKQLQGYACGQGSSGVPIDGREWTIWQISGIIAPILFLMAYELGDSETANAIELDGARLAGRAVEHICEMVLRRFSIIDPTRVTAASALATSIDTCFTAIAAAEPWHNQAGYAFPKHSALDLTTSSTWDPQQLDTRMLEPSASNAGQVTQHCPVLYLGEVFKRRLHQISGFKERLRLLRQLVLTQRPELASGQNHNSGDGAAWYQSVPDGTAPAQAAPVAVFTATPTEGTPPLTVQFDASGSTVQGLADDATWSWWAHYDGGAPTTTITGPAGQTWSWTYAAEGNYSPRLQITDDLGQSEPQSIYALTQGIRVRETTQQDPPSPAITPSTTSGEEPLSVTFDGSDSTVNGNTSPSRWEWWANYTPGDTPDQNKLYEEGGADSFSHTYQSDGVYSPRLRITDDRGQQGVLELTNGILVSPSTTQHDPPIPTFTVDPSSGEATLAVDFDASGSTVLGVQASATWDWYADANDSLPTETIEGPSGATWSHSYTEVGVFSPKLIITDDLGQEGTFVFLNGVVVHGGTPDPVDVEFTPTPTTIYPNEVVSITNDTSDGEQAFVQSWVWEYKGPDTNSTWLQFWDEANPPALRLVGVGDYSIRCTATGAFGTDTETQTDVVTVEALPTEPTASFTLSTYSSFAREVWIDFLNTSTNYEKADWDLGDGTVFSGPKPPPHRYYKPGTYTIRLVVTDSSGVQDVTTRALTILSGKESFGVLSSSVSSRGKGS